MLELIAIITTGANVYYLRSITICAFNTPAFTTYVSTTPVFKPNIAFAVLYCTSIKPSTTTVPTALDRSLEKVERR